MNKKEKINNLPNQPADTVPVDQPAPPVEIKKPLPYKFIAMIGILFFLIIGGLYFGLYFWKKAQSKVSQSELPAITGSAASQNESVPALAPVSTSTGIDDLQAEVNATDLGDFEADLNNLDSQANQL